LDKAEQLDHLLAASQMKMQLGSLHLESGAIKQADTLLREALSGLWAMLKEPHPFLIK
jgi:hypothetical protein